MTLHADVVRHGRRIAVACALLALGQAPSLAPHAAHIAAAPVRKAPSPVPVVARRADPPVPSAAPAPAPAQLPGPAAPLADPFAATSWAPPPPPVPAATQTAAATAAAAAAAAGAGPPGGPPPPVAPPLPFVYVGRYVEGSRQIVLLMKGEQLLLVQQGDTIDNLYRLERVAADRIELTYLPLGMRQSVRTFDSA
jgi:hypothetical protein